MTQPQHSLATTTPMRLLKAASVFLLLSNAPKEAMAWGNNGDSYAIFGNGLERDWLYNSQGIAIEVHGCLWSYMTDKDNEDAGCLEESSEDGTEVWYMMSNCRRAQVAFSVYASDSGTPSCNSNYFKESFVTTTSVMDFVAYLSEYGGIGFSDDSEYDMCGDGYVGLSCASDGSFQLEQFNDAYCLTRTGSQYDDLYNFNSDMSQLSCVSVYGGNNNGDGGGGNGYLIQYLIGISDSCSSYDTGLCQDSEAAQERHGYTDYSSGGGVFHRKPLGSGGQSWFTKLKYVTGGLLLLASFVMFTGILFTNRRRRRALMQRKYRQSKRGGRSADNRSRRSSRSASKARDSASRKSSSRPRRSKSRDHRESSSPKKDSRNKGDDYENSEGILT